MEKALIGMIKEPKKEKILLGYSFADTFESTNREARTRQVCDYYFNLLVENIMKHVPVNSNSEWLKLYLNKKNYYYTLTQLRTDNYIHQKYDFNYELRLKTDDYYKKMGSDIIGESTDLLRFNLEETGNCCGSMTLCDIRNNTQIASGKGVISILLKMIEDIAKAQKTTQLLAINTIGNNFTNSLINTHGFKVKDEFMNPNSGNVCVLLSKLLNYKEFKKEEIKGTIYTYEN